MLLLVHNCCANTSAHPGLCLSMCGTCVALQSIRTDLGGEGERKGMDGAGEGERKEARVR